MKTKLCRPILVEGKEFTNLVKTLPDTVSYTTTPNIPGGKYQHLILISLDPDDKIREGTLVYRHYEDGGSHIGLATPKADELKRVKDNRVWKVIVTQDQLSPEYIQQFIEEYNKGVVKDVEIELEKLYSYEAADKFDEVGFYGFRPKLTNDFVTIVEKEVIKDNYTREEVVELCKSAFVTGTRINDIDYFKWEEQNL